MSKKLLVALLIMGTYGGPVVSSTKCMNLTNELETCGPRQYCSDSPLYLGCRNCSVVAEHCEEEGLLIIRQKFPVCELQCEERRRKRTEEELKATGVALREKEKQLNYLEQTLNKTETELGERARKAEKQVENLSERNQTLWIAVLVLAVILGVVLITNLISWMVRIYKWCSKQRAAMRNNDCTAAPEVNSCLLKLLRRCFLPKAQQRLRRPCAEDGQHQQEATIPLDPAYIASTQEERSLPPESSGRGSIPTSSNSSLAGFRGAQRRHRTSSE